MSRERLKTLGRRLMIACAALLACAQAIAGLRLLGAALERAPALVVEALSFGGSGREAIAKSREEADAVEQPAQAAAVLVRKEPSKTPPVIVAAVAPAKVPEEDPLLVRRCPGISALIVTELPKGKGSMALLHDARGTSQRRVGDHFRDKQVAGIGFNPRESSPAVWLSGKEGLCQVILFAGAHDEPEKGPSDAQAAPNAETSRPSASATESERVLADVTQKIRKVSDTEFDVDRSAVDQILEHQGQLMRNVRLVPDAGGKGVGPRLFGIRPNSMLAALGMKSGDRLDSINGFSMGTPEGALEAYARLRNTDSLSVKVERGGQPVALTYRIR